MNHLRQLFAAALAAGMLAFAPPALAQDHAQVDGPAEQHEAVGLDGIADGGDEAADTSAPSDAEPAAEEALVDDPDAAMADVELEETRSPWSTGLIMSITAMCIGGFSAVLGIWVDRDQSRPKVFAFSMSFLIMCALVVGVAQSYLDEVDRIEKDGDLERMLDMTFEIAHASGDPALIALVEETAGAKTDADDDAPTDEPAE
jgi:MFS family permease